MGQFPEPPIESKFKSLPTRVITALILAAVALGAYLGGPITFFILCVVLVGVLLFELGGLHSSKFSKPKRAGFVLYGCGVSAVSAFYLLKDEIDYGLLINLSFLFILGLGLILRFKIHMVVIGAGVFHAVLGYMLAYLQSNLLFLGIVLLIVGTDAGGYFAGKLIGGPKILPKISPKKTWSGTIGGWVFAVLILFGFVYFWRNEIPSPIVIITAVLISIFSQLGDLYISFLKRKVGVKDSSNLLPGHGGFLDRFDSFIGAGVLIFFLILFLLFHNSGQEGIYLTDVA